MKNLLLKLFDKTFLKFIIVGIANTFCGTGIMFLFYNVFHFGYWVSSALNYIFGSVMSYFLNKRFTFKTPDNGRQPVVRFAINIAVCYVVAYGLAKPLIKLILSGFQPTLQDNVAMLTGMCLFVICNYLGQRFFVFKNI